MASGMWQGLNAAFQGAMERKTREKELQDARDQRQSEFQQQLELEDKRYNRDKADAAQLRKEALAQHYQDIYLPAFVEANGRRKAATEMNAEAAGFLEKFQGFEDHPTVVALRNRPDVTAALAKEYASRVEKYTAKGLTATFDPQKVLEGIAINGSGEPVPLFDMGQISTVSTFDDLVGALTDLSQPLPSFGAELDPNFMVAPDATNLTVARDMFKENLFTQAALARDAFAAAQAEDPTNTANQTGYDRLADLIEKASGNDPAAVAELNNLYGQKAFNTLAASGNEYLVELSNDPKFAQFAATRNQQIEALQAKIDDPNTSEADRQTAENYLRALQGTN